jgi:hypothetical protein
MVVARFFKRLSHILAFAAFTAALLPAQSGAAVFDRIPEPNPPTIEKEAAEAPGAKAAADFMAPSAITEWTYHKTDDNLHPDGYEQQMLWLMNRARSDPAQEGSWLATLNDPDIAAARAYWGVDLSVLRNEFAAIAATPPAAFDVRLYYAARAQSDYLIGIDSQTHDGQFSRIDAAGFQYTTAAGIVFSYAESALYGHAGFNIDWGPGTDGTQDPPGHRNAIMSVSGNYTNVGYAVVAELNPATAVGPLVIAGDLCYANTGYANHYNRFLVGTVWVDSNGNDQYDPGEGIGGVTVEPDQGTYFAVTADSGGYAIPMTATGTYAVTFSGSAITTPVTRTVAVGSTSVLLDLKYALASSSDGGGGGGGGGGPCLISAAGDESGGASSAGWLLAGLTCAGLMVLRGRMCEKDVPRDDWVFCLKGSVQRGRQAALSASDLRNPEGIDAFIPGGRDRAGACNRVRGRHRRRPGQLSQDHGAEGPGSAFGGGRSLGEN